MTTSDERTLSLYLARSFLADLLDPKKTPGVPRAIRKEASARLKHYPMPCDLDEMCGRVPSWGGKASTPAPLTQKQKDAGYTSVATREFTDTLNRDIARYVLAKQKVTRRVTRKKSFPKTAHTVVGKSNREAGCWL